MAAPSLSGPAPRVNFVSRRLRPLWRPSQNRRLGGKTGPRGWPFPCNCL